MKEKKRIYLDNASTTPIDSEVFKTMLPYLKEQYGNPSSIHLEGRKSKSTIENSREKIASVIGAEPEEIIFTSGGTEADNLAMFGIARANKSKGKHIIVSGIEHKAILESCKRLEKEGFEITYLEVNNHAVVSLEHLKKSLRKDTILVSVMYANNEVGTIQSLKEIAKILKASKSEAVFHTDACQAVGALPILIKDLGIDAMTISSSKIYGPKGVGCIYLNKKINIEPIVFGGGQEKGKRAGTENVANIVGFAKAIEIAEKKREKEFVRLSVLRVYFIDKILKDIKGVTLNGDRTQRLPNNINISVSGVEGESLLLLLDDAGVACSTGSACSANDLKPSHVLIKCAISAELAHCSVRFTLGRYTTKKDLIKTLEILKKAVENIRNISTIKTK